MWREFKNFALKGNIVDLAIAFIIGGAFSKIVTSLVNDIIMPIIGGIIGKVDFSNLFINLSGTHYKTLAKAKEAGAATLNYGIFINNIIDFLIIAFSLFIVVRQLNRLNKFKKTEVPVVTTKKCPYCFTEISIDATRCPHCTSMLDTKNL